MVENIKLKVVEALQDDAYKGIARIDFDVMRQLGIKRGDVILIKGGKETVAIADNAATIQKILLPLSFFFENPTLFVSNPPTRAPCSSSVRLTPRCMTIV